MTAFEEDNFLQSAFVESWMGIVPIRTTPLGYLEQQQTAKKHDEMATSTMDALTSAPDEEVALKEKYSRMILSDPIQNQSNDQGPNGPQGSGRRSNKKIPTFKFSSRR